MIKSLKVVRSLYHADDPPKLNSCLTELEGLREMQSDGEGEEKVGATFYNKMLKMIKLRKCSTAVFCDCVGLMSKC